MIGFDVKVSLKKQIIIPMLCVICGNTRDLYPRGYIITGTTSHIYINYRSQFAFPVCDKCARKREKINEKRKRFRSQLEKAYLKLYDKQAVVCRLGYRPILGIKWAKFTFYNKDFAEAFERANEHALL